MLHKDLCPRCEGPLGDSPFCGAVIDDPLCVPCVVKNARKHFALQEGVAVSAARLESLFLRFAVDDMCELRADPKRYASEVADLAFALTSASFAWLKIDEREAEHDAEMRAAEALQ